MLKDQKKGIPWKNAKEKKDKFDYKKIEFGAKEGFKKIL